MQINRIKTAEGVQGEGVSSPCASGAGYCKAEGFCLAGGGCWAVVGFVGRWLLGIKKLPGLPWQEIFHRLSASIESDGVRKASSATFFHLPDDYFNPNGLKILVLSLFSISQRLIKNAMDWKKLLFQVRSIARMTFSASMVKQPKWIPSPRKFS